jgi:hypothetical protein
MDPNANTSTFATSRERVIEVTCVLSVDSENSEVSQVATGKGFARGREICCSAFLAIGKS